MAFLNILERSMIFLTEQELSGLHEYFKNSSAIFL